MASPRETAFTTHIVSQLAAQKKKQKTKNDASDIVTNEIWSAIQTYLASVNEAPNYLNQSEVSTILDNKPSTDESSVDGNTKISYIALKVFCDTPQQATETTLLYDFVSGLIWGLADRLVYKVSNAPIASEAKHDATNKQGTGTALASSTSSAMFSASASSSSTSSSGSALSSSSNSSTVVSSTSSTPLKPGGGRSTSPARQ